MTIIILSGILSIIWASLSQKNKTLALADCSNVTINKYQKFTVAYYVMSFLSLAIPCFVCGTGTDMPVYIDIYENASLNTINDSKFEPGYILLNIILRFFFKNAYIGLGVIKVVSLFLIYKSLYMLRDRVHIGFSIASYVVLLYIFNYHLLRICLAVGMVFLALSYEMCGKTKRSFVLLASTIFIHYSSLIVLITFIAYKILGREMRPLKIVILSLLLMIIYTSIVPIVSSVLTSVTRFDKYSTYFNQATTDSGKIQLILFVPIAYILLIAYRYGKRDKFYILNFLFGLMLYFAGSLGYIFPVAGRTTYYFFWFAVAFFGATPLLRDKIVFVAGKVRINSTSVVAVVYLILQGIISYFLTNSFVSNGLTQFIPWWGL